MIEVFNLGNARSYTSEIRFPRFIPSENLQHGLHLRESVQGSLDNKKSGKTGEGKVPPSRIAPGASYKHGDGEWKR